MMQKDLTCKELVQLLTDYLEEALPPPEIQRFQGHMGICPECVIYVEQMRITVRVTGQLPPESIDPSVRHRLIEVFRGWKATH